MFFVSGQGATSTSTLAPPPHVLDYNTFILVLGGVDYCLLQHCYNVIWTEPSLGSGWRELLASASVSQCDEEDPCNLGHSSGHRSQPLYSCFSAT